MEVTQCHLESHTLEIVDRKMKGAYISELPPGGEVPIVTVRWKRSMFIMLSH